MTQIAIPARATIAALVLGLAAVVFVQPWRETAFAEEWQNAAMVRQILEAGRFERLDSVASAPLPQLYWGALFGSGLGSSYGALRVSTLALAIAGLFAFHRLCRDQGLNGREASLLTATLAAAPLFAVRSFGFLSEVPLVAGLVASVLFFGRSLRDRDRRTMLLASLLIALTILQQALGLALLAAQVVFWLVSRSRRHEWRFFGVGLPLPVIAALALCASPNWMWRARTAELVRHLSDAELPFEGLWRIAVLLAYAGLCALPIGLLAFGKLRRAEGPEPGGPRAFFVATACAALGLALGVALLGRAWRLPWLGGDLAVSRHWPTWLSIAASSLVLLLAGALGASLFSTARAHARAQQNEATRFLHVTLAFLFLGLLLQAKLRDPDVLSVLPFLLVVLGRETWSRREPTRVEARMALAVALAVAMIGWVWIRGRLSLAEALWSVGESALAQGIAPELVASSSREWQLAHGAFDRWRASQADPAVSAVDAALAAPTPAEFGRAQYWVLERVLERERERDPAGFRPLERREFRGALGRRRVVELVQPEFSVPACTSGSFPAFDGSGWWQWSGSRLDCRFEREEVPADTVVASFEALATTPGRTLRLRIGGESFQVSLSTSPQQLTSPAVSVPQAQLDLEFTLSGARLVSSETERAAFRLKNLRLDPAPDAVSYAPVAATWECSGGHLREVDGASSWYWTPLALDCVVTPAEALDGSVVVSFEYFVPDANRRLRSRISGVVREITASGAVMTFRSVPLAATDLPLRIELDLAGEGVVTRISPEDARLGAFFVRDLRLERTRARAESP